MRGRAGNDPTQLDDAALVSLCIGGDQVAWETLVARYQRLVYSVALRCGLQDDDADDVFQIVFTTLFRRLEGLRDQQRLASWLITTTSREAWRVARSRRTGGELEEDVLDTSAPPPEMAENADRDQRVRDALAKLDDKCRALLTELFLESEAPNYSAIAGKLGMAVGSIGPTRARCFKKLESFLIDAGLS